MAACGTAGASARAGGEKIKRKLAEDLSDLRGGSGSYRVAGIWGRSDAHCMAAYRGWKNITFFDPNFGEFWFDDKAKFESWFANSFFVRSTYSKLMDDRYALHDYALKV